MPEQVRVVAFDQPAGGRHRAESITNDLTVENVGRWRAYNANVKRTHYTGHLGVPGRHEVR